MEQEKRGWQLAGQTASREVLLECFKVGETEFNPDGEDPQRGKD